MKNPFIIAEIGQSHDGSLGMVHSYIDALSNSGVDALKFQMHIAEAESSNAEPFRVNFSYQDTTRFEYWKRMSFTLTQWKEIKTHCNNVNLEFICSPFSNIAVERLQDIGVERYKIGSGEINNFLLLQKIVDTRKPVILSSGMSNYFELDAAVNFLKSNNVEYSILQCTTAYPTLPQQYGLNVIGEYKLRYDVKVGYSDHSGKLETLIAAAALGAEIFEFHVVFDRRQFGPDSKSSLTIEEVFELTKSLRNIANAISSPVDKNEISPFIQVKEIFEKSISINKNLIEGHVLSFDDLEGKKPRGLGISAKDFRQIIGKKINREMKQWDFLNWSDLYE